jgi:hypothetical protein
MRLIRISGLSLILFALILSAFLRQPLPEPLPVLRLRANDCQPPCWFGIEPGKTTRGEMETLLAQYPDLFSTLQYINIFPTGFTQCWQIKPYRWQVCIGEGRDSAQPVPYLRFLPPRGALTLGRAIQQFGKPKFTLGCLASATPQPNNPFRGMSVQFGEHILVTAYNVAQNGQALIPQMIVETITYEVAPLNSQSIIRELSENQIWHGFGVRSIFPTLCIP